MGGKTKEKGKDFKWRTKEKKTYLLALVLNQLWLILDNFHTLILTGLEQFWQTEPLSCNLVSIGTVAEPVYRNPKFC